MFLVLLLYFLLSLFALIQEPVPWSRCSLCSNQPCPSPAAGPAAPFNPHMFTFRMSPLLRQIFSALGRQGRGEGRLFNQLSHHSATASTPCRPKLGVRLCQKRVIGFKFLRPETKTKQRQEQTGSAGFPIDVPMPEPWPEVDGGSCVSTAHP